MTSKGIICASLLVIILALETSLAQKYTICTTPPKLNACEQLNRSDDLKCVLRKNAVNCLLMVENGTATFTSVTAEEAFLASSLTNNLVVLGEFISTVQRSNTDFETVILARTDFNEGFNSLKGAKICHPGIDINQLSPFILKEFDTQVLTQNNIDICPSDVNRDINEHYLNALNDFFGSSCRQGSWVLANKTLDGELKRKYPRLMELCETTSYQENRHQPFLQSLKCLLSGSGDIALTTMNTITSYNATNPGNFQNYTYICKNGTRVPVSSGASCIWTKQSWPLLIGNKDQVVNVPTDLRNWFIMQPVDGTQLNDRSLQSLKEIIFPANDMDINVTFHTPGLESYMRDFRDKPTAESPRLCKASVILCVTSSEEERKCKWLQQAALNYGIQPVIDCINKNSKMECLKALQNKMADLAVVDANMMYTADRWNSSVVAFGEERTQDMIQTILVVNSTAIKSIQDLQGKNGYFAEYGDIAWLAFSNLLKNNAWTEPTNYGEELSKYLNSSCMPGALDQDRELPGTNITVERVCGLCDANSTSAGINCNADASNSCYGNSGALKCLTTFGDFAVVSVTANLTLPTNTSILCKNGTLLSITTLNNIDNDCALSVTASDVVIAGNSRPKNRDIENMLQDFDERFAAQSHTPFKIFDIFGETKDLIFRDTTLGIEAAPAVTNRYSKAQLELFTNIPRPKPVVDGDGGNGGDGGSNGDGGGDDSAATSTISLFLIFTTIFTYFLI